MGWDVFMFEGLDPRAGNTGTLLTLDFGIDGADPGLSTVQFRLVAAGATTRFGSFTNADWHVEVNRPGTINGMLHVLSRIQAGTARTPGAPDGS